MVVGLRCWNCQRPFRPEARYCGACGVRLVISTPLQRDASGLTAGATLSSSGRYRVEQRIGRGGFGEAYLATDTWLHRPCVIKRLRADLALDALEQQRVEENFVREARLLVALNTPGHPNIPEIYDLLLDERCLVMKYIQGRSLQAILDRRSGGLPEQEALRYAREICAALAYLHSRPEPVVHRDVKPANVLIDDEGRIWLVDFGLSKATLAPLEAVDGQSGGAGTIGYAPLEQWAGRSEPRSDIFALGVTLQTMLTNQMPEEGRTTTNAGYDEPTPPPGSLQSALVQVLARCLAPAAAARPSAAELLAELDRLLAEPNIPPPPAPQRPPLPDTPVVREAALASVLGCLEAEGACLLVGPAGVGKSSLVGAVAGAWAGPEVTWYACRAGEGSTGLIWSLAGFLHGQGRPELWRWLHSAAQPGVPPPPPEVLARTLLGQLRGQPCLICLDDLHLAADDPAMADLLGQLLNEARSGSLRLLASGQQALPLFDPALVVGLEGMNPAESRALLAARGGTLEPALAEALIGLTAGNPQFLSLAAVAMQQGADPASLLRDLPHDERIADYLIEAVDRRLSLDEREVMRAVAALLGEPATRDAVEALLERDDLWPVLQQLRSRRLLHSVAGTQPLAYAQHGIVRGFFYGQLGLRARRQFHARAGAYFEHDAPAPLHAARHYALAGDMARAARLALRDIWASVNSGEARPLAGLLGQIDPQRLAETQAVELRLARGEIGSLLGEADAAQEHLAAAYAAATVLGDQHERLLLAARACRAMGGLLEYSDADAALVWLRRGLALLAGAEPLLDETLRLEQARLQHRVGAALLALGDYDEALLAHEAALAQLPAGAYRARADGLLNLGVIHCSQGRMAEGQDSFERAIGAYTLAEDVWGLTAARHNLAQVIELAGEWQRAALEYGEVLALAQKLGDVRGQVRLGLSLGILQTNRGTYDEAARTLAACVALAQASDDREGCVAAQASLADLLLRRGEWLPAAGLLDATEAMALAMGDDHPHLPEIWRSRALVQLAQGELVAAHTTAERAAAAAADDPREQGLTQRVLGLVALAEGQTALGLALLDASAALLDDADPYEAARSRLAQGRALRENGQAEAGTTLLGVAEETFARLGAQGELASVARLA